MTTLYLIRGLPGSGKSTLAKLSGLPTFEADDFFMHNGEYRYRPDLIAFAQESCKLRAVQALYHEQSVCISNTMTRRWEILQYLTAVEQVGGIKIKVIKCVGNFSNSHEVPPERVAVMASRWENWEGEVTVTPDEYKRFWSREKRN